MRAERALATSSRILVTHLTDVQNTGAEYADAEMRICKENGHLPYLMRCGVAGIELKIANGPAEWRVWALSPSGIRIAEIPCHVEDGALRFTADTARDPSEATFLYELSIEGVRHGRALRSSASACGTRRRSSVRWAFPGC